MAVVDVVQSHFHESPIITVDDGWTFEESYFGDEGNDRFYCPKYETPEYRMTISKSTIYGGLPRTYRIDIERRLLPDSEGRYLPKVLGTIERPSRFVAPYDKPYDHEIYGFTYYPSSGNIEGRGACSIIKATKTSFDELKSFKPSAGFTDMKFLSKDFYDQLFDDFKSSSVYPK